MSNHEHPAGQSTSPETGDPLYGYPADQAPLHHVAGTEAGAGEDAAEQLADARQGVEYAGATPTANYGRTSQPEPEVVQSEALSAEEVRDFLHRHRGVVDPSGNPVDAETPTAAPGEPGRAHSGEAPPPGGGTGEERGQHDDLWRALLLEALLRQRQGKGSGESPEAGEPSAASAPEPPPPEPPAPPEAPPAPAAINVAHLVNELSLQSLPLEDVRAALDDPSGFPRPITREEHAALEAWYGRAAAEAERQALLREQRAEADAQRAAEQAARDAQLRKEAAAKKLAYQQLVAGEQAGFKQACGKLPAPHPLPDLGMRPGRYDLSLEDPLAPGPNGRPPKIPRQQHNEELASRESFAELTHEIGSTTMDRTRLAGKFNRSLASAQREQYLAHHALATKFRNKPQELVAYAQSYTPEDLNDLPFAERVALEMALAQQAPPNTLGGLQHQGIFSTFAGKKALNERVEVLSEIEIMLHTPSDRINDLWQKEEQKLGAPLTAKNTPRLGRRQEYVNELRHWKEHLDDISEKIQDANRLWTAVTFTTAPVQAQLYQRIVQLNNLYHNNTP